MMKRRTTTNDNRADYLYDQESEGDMAVSVIAHKGWKLGPKRWKIGKTEVKMGGPSKGRTVGRKRKEPDLKRYSGRLAARLRSLRERAGKTAEEMADSLKVPISTYYAYENHNVALPTDLIPSVAKALGVNPRSVTPEK